MPRTRVERPSGLSARTKNTKDGGIVKPKQAGKRQAEEPAEGKTRKRAVFGDITNAVTEGQNSITKQVKKGISNIVNKSKSEKTGPTKKAKKSAPTKKPVARKSAPKKDSSVDSLPSSQVQILKNSALGTPEEEPTGVDESDYESAKENLKNTSASIKLAKVKPARYQPPARPIPPPGVEDFDKENWNDPNQCPEYAMDTFYYYQHREKEFAVHDYMGNQPEVNHPMRAILVDWLVEVQESFELNHEALYTAVKILDIYMSRAEVPKEELQLVGATACLIACKIDERLPPMLDDFVYVCDDAYNRNQIMEMERKVFDVVGFDVGAPLSYRFVRRYARVKGTTQ